VEIDLCVYIVSPKNCKCVVKPVRNLSLLDFLLHSTDIWRDVSCVVSADMQYAVSGSLDLSSAYYWYLIVNRACVI
jgi:hypothetical protein